MLRIACTNGLFSPSKLFALALVIVRPWPRFSLWRQGFSRAPLSPVLVDCLTHAVRAKAKMPIVRSWSCKLMNSGRIPAVCYVAILKSVFGNCKRVVFLRIQIPVAGSDETFQFRGVFGDRFDPGMAIFAFPPVGLPKTVLVYPCANR